MYWDLSKLTVCWTVPRHRCSIACVYSVRVTPELLATPSKVPAWNESRWPPHIPAVAVLRVAQIWWLICSLRHRCGTRRTTRGRDLSEDVHGWVWLKNGVGIVYNTSQKHLARTKREPKEHQHYFQLNILIEKTKIAKSQRAQTTEKPGTKRIRTMSLSRQEIEYLSV